MRKAVSSVLLRLLAAAPSTRSLASRRAVSDAPPGRAGIPISRLLDVGLHVCAECTDCASPAGPSGEA